MGNLVAGLLIIVLVLAIAGGIWFDIAMSMAKLKFFMGH